MKILLNNREEEFDSESMTIDEILKAKNFTFKMLVIKLNKVYIDKKEYSSVFVKAEDDLQILHLISGG